MVNSNMLNSGNMVMRSLRRTFIFVHAAAVHFNSTEQLKQEKTKLCMLHVQVNVAGQTACLFPLWFLCGKRNRGYCSEAVVNLGCLCFYTPDAELGRPNSTRSASAARLVVVIRSCWIFAAVGASLAVSSSPLPTLHRLSSLLLVTYRYLTFLAVDWLKLSVPHAHFVFAWFVLSFHADRAPIYLPCSLSSFLYPGLCWVVRPPSPLPPLFRVPLPPLLLSLLVNLLRCVSWVCSVVLALLYLPTRFVPCPLASLVLFCTLGFGAWSFWP